MKIKSVSLPLILIAFSFLLFTACKDKSAESKPESHTELHASAAFQCPMDCEDGKTYEEAGSCPVCKMDLKEANQPTSMTCKQHKDGTCTCNGETCTCDDCPMHAKDMVCSMHKDGTCSCNADECTCDNCPIHT